MLELKGAGKKSAHEVLIEDVSLTLERGSFNILLGPTLSGKTTLMRLMAGLERLDTGSLSIDGQDVTNLPVQKRSVAMVYQQFINYPAMTVYENIASPLRVAKMDNAQIDREVRSIAELLRLTPYLDRLPLNLSGGQQQRIALSRALVKRADLILLDEPLANLDYKLREELREELPKIFSDSKTIFVYATTEPQEALLLGGNTATLSEGRVSQFGKTIDVFRNPNNLITAQTFSDPPLNITEIKKEAGNFVFGDNTLWPVPSTYTSLPDGPYTIGFQPHHIYHTRQNENNISLPVIVRETDIGGSESYIHVIFSGAYWVILTPGIIIPEPGKAIDVFIDPQNFLLFRPNGQTV